MKTLLFLVGIILVHYNCFAETNNFGEQKNVLIRPTRSDDAETCVLCPADTTYRLKTQSDVDNFMIENNCNIIQGMLFIGSNDLSSGKSSHINNLNGLENIKSISGSLVIMNVQTLTNIDSMLNLRYVGGSLHILYNNDLTNIDGLRNLKYLHGAIGISSNRLLKNIKGLFKIESVYDEIYISGNSVLTSLEGLNVKNIFNPNFFSQLGVYSNDKLSDCSQLCDLLNNGTVNHNTRIFENSGTCTDKQSILSFCSDKEPR